MYVCMYVCVCVYTPFYFHDNGRKIKNETSKFGGVWNNFYAKISCNISESGNKEKTQTLMAVCININVSFSNLVALVSATY
jgi:hypothetical protein